VSNEPNLDVAGKPPLSTDTHSTDTLSTDIHSTDTHSTDTHSTDIHSTDTQAEPDPPTSKIYASVVTQPKPEYAAKYATLAEEPVVLSKQEKTKSSNSSESHKVDTPLFTEASNHSFSSNASHQIPEPPPFLLKKDIPETGDAATTGFATEERTKINTPAAKQTGPEQKPSVNLSEKLSMSEQARNLVKRKKADAVAKRREPKISEEQMRIDFDEQPTAVPETKEELKAKPDGSEQQQEVLVLNVKSADNNPIPGAGLLPMLLTLGFKFGDQDIFHRHVNSNGKGPVLFSLANMFKPGNFDIDSLETFSTQGISLFMILPIEGEPHQVFNMMHNAARKIADEFSAQIYDGRRTLLTKQSLQQYVEKIREFERQRLLRG
jgi:cell division protein ZipA